MVDQDSTFSHYFTLLAPLRPHYPQLYNAMAHLPRRRDDPQRKRHGSFSRKSPRKTPQDEKDENSRLCVICATEKPGTDYLSPEQAPCYCGDIQESVTCRQCMARYMTMQIEERPDVPLACMHCGRKWSFEHARRMLPRDVAALYDSILAQRCMKAIPGFLLCPYPDCTAGAIHNTSCPDFPCVQCQACSRSSCQACRTPWQKGHSCAEFSSSREASRRTFRALREKGARRCPRCHYVIMKAGGCNHMCCSACGTSFSWTWKAKIVDEGSDPDFPTPTRSELLQSALRKLLTRLHRHVQRVLSKPARVALQRRLE